MMNEETLGNLFPKPYSMPPLKHLIPTGPKKEKLYPKPTSMLLFKHLISTELKKEKPCWVC
jgi:hypothetical protein